MIGYNFFTMRKLFLVFALLMFPIQVTWATMEGYCLQLQGSVSRHCGACAQRACTDLESSQKPHVPTAAELGSGCNYCGASSAAMVSLKFDVLSALSTAFPRSANPDLLLLAFAERPECPQWWFTFA